MLTTRRTFTSLAANAAACSALGFPYARAATAPGVTATEIKIGQTCSYSGPASSYGLVGRIQLAYLKMINERGGVNGRRIELISLDDGYSPQRTVELTRRLIEQERVSFMWGSVGTATNLAVRDYLNGEGVPQLFVTSGSSLLADPHRFPWTLPGLFPYRSEGRLFAKHILASDPHPTVSVLYQNDDFGKDCLSGLSEVLGSAGPRATLRTQSFEVSEPSVDSQIVALKSAKSEYLVLATIPEVAAQAIRKTYDIGWRPARYVTYVASAISSVMNNAGAAKARGAISTAIVKNPDDPGWRDDPAMVDYLAFMAKYLPDEPATDFSAALAYESGWTLVELIKTCGDDLSREHILWQATHLANLKGPLLLPGASVTVTPDDYRPLRTVQLERFDGKRWRVFGFPIES